MPIFCQLLPFYPLCGIVVNMISKIVSSIQLLSALLLIAAILLQQKGAGLGVAFGGSSNVYSTKRGIDKVLFRITVILSIIFFGIALVGLVT